MQHNKEHIQELLIEKLAGTITVEDNDMLQKVIETDVEINIMWKNISEKMSSKRSAVFLNNLDPDSAWEKVKDSIGTGSDKRYKITIKRWMSVAAALLLISSAIVLLNYYKPAGYAAHDLKGEHRKYVQLQFDEGKNIDISSDTRKQLDLKDAELNINGNHLSYIAKKGSSDVWSTVKVPPTMDYKMVLSDGTEVWLNAASDLRFPLTFSGARREVYLKGEAYFKVTKNPEHPFIVHSGEIAIRVLGTSFNVNAYNSVATTSLVEGSVIASSENYPSKTLKPGYKAIFNSSQGFQVKTFDKDTELSWMSGVEHFFNQPLSEISEILPRWFDVVVVFDNQNIKNQPFTGIIEKNKPLAIFLSNIKTSAGIDSYVKNGVLHLK